MGILAGKTLVDLNGVETFSQIRKSGYMPFSLGPIYVYAGVPTSLIDSFRDASEHDVSKRPHEMRHTTIAFEHEVLAYCPGWMNIIDVMDTESYQWFKKWMLSLNFSDRVKKTFFVPRHYMAAVMDPVAWGLRQQLIPETLDVYGVSGIRGNLKPVSNFSGLTNVPVDEIINQNPDRLDKIATPSTYIRLEVHPPEEDVQITGKAMLNLLEEA